MFIILPHGNEIRGMDRFKKVCQSAVVVYWLIKM